VTAAFRMVDVAFPGWTHAGGCRLTFPMDQGWADGVVTVCGGRSKTA